VAAGPLQPNKSSLEMKWYQKYRHLSSKER
jgi:hypothetical protein